MKQVLIFSIRWQGGNYIVRGEDGTERVLHYSIKTERQAKTWVKETLRDRGIDATIKFN